MFYLAMHSTHFIYGYMVLQAMDSGAQGFQAVCIQRKNFSQKQWIQVLKVFKSFHKVFKLFVYREKSHSTRFSSYLYTEKKVIPQGFQAVCIQRKKSFHKVFKLFVYREKSHSTRFSSCLYTEKKVIPQGFQAVCIQRKKSFHKVFKLFVYREKRHSTRFSSYLYTEKKVIPQGFQAICIQRKKSFHKVFKLFVYREKSHSTQGIKININFWYNLKFVNGN